MLPGETLGLGVTIVAAYVLCTSGLTGAVAGAASGLVTTTFQIGGALGVALLTTIAHERASAVLAASTSTQPAAIHGRRQLNRAVGGAAAGDACGTADAPADDALDPSLMFGSAS